MKGIIRCDMIAESIIAAAAELGPLRVPIVVRLQGTNAEKGQEMVVFPFPILLPVHPSFRLPLQRPFSGVIHNKSLANACQDRKLLSRHPRSSRFRRSSAEGMPDG